LKRFVYTNNSFENTTEKANLSFAFNLEFNATSLENKSFHIYLIKSDIIPYFDLLNNPAICCSAEGGSICDDFYNENDGRFKNDDTKFSNLLKDHAEFYKDYALNETNKNLILKKFIQKKGDKFFYHNPNLSFSINNDTKDNKDNYTNVNNNKFQTNNFTEKDDYDYGSISADFTLIINEVRIKAKLKALFI